MAIIIGLLWGGYSIGYYGWNRITGGNDKFVSLVWPGKWILTARDDGTQSSSSGFNTKSSTGTNVPILQPAAQAPPVASGPAKGLTPIKGTGL